MFEHKPTTDESEDMPNEELNDESRRGFLRNAVGLGLGAVVGSSIPDDAEGGVLSGGVLKAAAARAALNSAEKRLASDEDKSKLEELEKAEAAAARECNAEFNIYMKQNPGKSDKNFLKTKVGVDCYAKWAEASKRVRDLKK